jgi:glycosyltransferase involved in cell wall biosynthesis
MVTISCSGKLHAFALAEQMARQGMLDDFYTSYSSNKNTFLRNFVRRMDKEEIPLEKIQTNTALAFPIKLWQSKVHIWNAIFDKWVARQILKSESTVFIGWSGMSLHSIRQAKGKGMLTILERGSSHIVVQDRILREEYNHFEKIFGVHPAVIRKELQEYEETDYISVPSFFVRDSFIQEGVPEEKLILNPYGANEYFTPSKKSESDEPRKFRIVYLGSLSIRKGLIYLFKALNQLKLDPGCFEIWFIGNVHQELQPFIDNLKRDNWKFFGHINHYDLRKYLIQCDIGVQPSLEEGLSMVIPQMMSCGIPVIITPNTGGENIIENDVSGLVVPIRDPKAIANGIEYLFNNKGKLAAMKTAAVLAIATGFTWNDYGKRYLNNILKRI